MEQLLEADKGVVDGLLDVESFIDRCKVVNVKRFSILIRKYLFFHLMARLVKVVSPKTANKLDEEKKKTPSRHNGSLWSFSFKCTKDAFRSVSRKLKLTDKLTGGLDLIFEFLNEETNLQKKNLFRKSGRKSSQDYMFHSLLEDGVHFHRWSDTPRYTAYDCAYVVKKVLNHLKEPLLTEELFATFCQIANLTRDHVSVEETRSDRILLFQLAFLSLPANNRKVLRQLLSVLHGLALHRKRNETKKLAKIFAMDLVCPRTMSAEEQKLIRKDMIEIVEFLIENTKELFQLPSSLQLELEKILKEDDEEYVIGAKHQNENNLSLSIKLSV